MNNIGHIILEVLIFLFIKSILYLTRKKLDKTNKIHTTDKKIDKTVNPNKNQSFYHRFVVWLDTKLNFVFFVQMALTLHLDLIIAAFINVRSFWIKPLGYFTNSVIALMVVIFYGVFIFKVFFESYKIEKMRIKISEDSSAIDVIKKGKRLSRKNKCKAKNTEEAS